MRKSLLFAALMALALCVAPFAGVAYAQDADIVDTAVAAGDFNTLVAAVQAAGLVDTLKGEGPFTVFAPTDAAFAALPEGTVDSLLADPTGALTDILLFHVVPGKVMAADLSDGLSANTVNGAPVTFTLSGDGAQVNGANIVATDIETTNGVIHVIDAVILPPADEAADMAAEATAAPTEEAMEETMEAEATPAPTEEAMEETMEAEATPAPTEEAMEETMEAEATAAPTEEAMEETMEAEATPAPTEEAMEEGGDMTSPEPETLPVTGAALPNATIPALLIVGVALFGAAYVTRRRS